MNEISKGMDNAAEQINENFESIETGLTEDVSNFFTPSNQSTTVQAFRQGKLIFLTVSTTPTNGGATVVTTELDLKASSALSVHKDGAVDNDKFVTAVFYEGSGLQIRASTAFTNSVRLTGVLILK